MKTKRRLIFPVHAIECFRAQWPDSAHMERSTICKAIEDQIREAKQNNNHVVREDGTYYPITLLGKDGYAVINGKKLKKVTAILSEEHYQNVTTVSNKKQSGAKQ